MTASTFNYAFDAFDPGQKVETVPYFELPAVNNSGLYRVTVHKAELKERIVKGETRTCIALSMIADHQRIPDHYGRLYTTIDLPVRGKTTKFDHIFNELVFFGGAVKQDAAGRLLPFFEVQDEQLDAPDSYGRTSRRIVTNLTGKEMMVVAQRNLWGDRVYMNARAFFGLDCRSMYEVKTGLQQASEIRSYCLDGEGLGLIFDTNRNSGNTGAASSFSPAASTSAGFNPSAASTGSAFQAAPVGQVNASASVQPQQPRSYSNFSGFPSYGQAQAQPQQMQAAAAAPTPTPTPAAAPVATPVGVTGVAVKSDDVPF